MCALVTRQRKCPNPKMSKSTPLSQLPNITTTAVSAASPSPQAPPIYNPNIENQRQQQAVQSFIMPQCTQTSTDIQAENDATIQEALNMLTPQPQDVQHQMPMPPMIMQQQQQQQQQQLPSPMMMPPEFMMPEFQQHLQAQGNDEQQYGKNALSELISLNTDIKSMVIVMVVFVVVSILPVEKFIYNYVALDKIPYSQVAIKAVLAGVIFIALSKLV